MLIAYPLFLAAAFAAPSGAGPDIAVSVDARDAARRVIHVHLTIPVRPGPLTLRYPQWIPGTHAPVTPINDLVGLHLSAQGKAVPWHRNPLDLYAFGLEVPAGARTLDVDLDHVMTPRNFLNEGDQATPSILILNFWPLVLYPEASGAASTFAVRVKLPAGYRWASPLPRASEAAGELAFAPVSLETLIDSPLLAGSHFKVVPLSKGDGAVELDLAGDSEGALALPPETVKAYEKLVVEAQALFGARHYRRYHFLVSLSDALTDYGLEHHEASDDRMSERALVDPEERRGFASLLPHEFVHSWNGKYRRPRGLATATPREPMDGSLLWVYEGLTEYLGSIVLAGRSGVSAGEDVRETLAYYAARMDGRDGRAWRPLADTAASAPTLYAAPGAWASWRRGVDFYMEGALLWLEADAKIRELTKGQRSLDDFCRAFHGGENGGPALRTYELDDVLAGLGAVAPYDWQGFFASRVDAVAPHAPRGLEAAGWKVVFDDKPNSVAKSWDANEKRQNEAFTLGILVHEDGTLVDVAPALPAGRAGVPPGAKLLAVGGRKYTPQVLKEALLSSKSGKEPLELLVQDGDFFRSFSVDYHGGLRFPHLQRMEGVPDRLADILRPRAR